LEMIIKNENHVYFVRTLLIIKKPQIFDISVAFLHLMMAFIFPFARLISLEILRVFQQIFRLRY
jgi:hypothetical protein